jgi:hypothetical protein
MVRLYMHDIRIRSRTRSSTADILQGLLYIVMVCMALWQWQWQGQWHSRPHALLGLPAPHAIPPRSRVRPSGACVCARRAGSGKIDLHSLDQAAKSPAFYVAQMSKGGGHLVSYWGIFNPCTALTGSWPHNGGNPPCTGSSACQTSEADGGGWGISMGGVGGNPEGGFDVNQSDSSVTIKLTSPGSGRSVRRASIKLLCDPQSTDPTAATFAAVSPTENPTQTYTFTLQSMCACPGRCPVAPPPPPGPSPGPPTPPPGPAPGPPPPTAAVQHHRKTAATQVSTGTALLLIFFLGGGSLMLAGTTFKYKVQGRRGKEAVPLVDVWAMLPALIREGFEFTWLSLREKWAARRGS